MEWLVAQFVRLSVDLLALIVRRVCRVSIGGGTAACTMTNHTLWHGEYAGDPQLTAQPIDEESIGDVVAAGRRAPRAYPAQALPRIITPPHFFLRQ